MDPQPHDDSSGFCCVAAGMHMGHDEDCPGYHCPECGGKGYTDYESGVVAPDGTHEWLKEPCGSCNPNDQILHLARSPAIPAG